MRHRGLKHNTLGIYLIGIGFVLLLLGIDYLATERLLIPLYSELGISPPKTHSLLGSTVTAGFALIMAGYVVFPRLSDIYMLLDKPATALAVSLCLSGLVALHYPLNLSIGLSLLLMLIAFGNLCASYQRSQEVHLYLRLGLILFVLSLLDVRMLLLLPLLLYSGAIVSSLGARAVGALLVGFLAPSLLFASYLLFILQWEGLCSILMLWLQPLLRVEFIGLRLRADWDILVLITLSLASAMSYTVGRSTESIRQRRQGGILVAWAVYSSALLLLYPTPLIATCSLIATAYLGARAISFLNTKSYNIALSIIAIALSLITVLI